MLSLLLRPWCLGPLVNLPPVGLESVAAGSVVSAGMAGTVGISVPGKRNTKKRCLRPALHAVIFFLTMLSFCALALWARALVCACGYFPSELASGYNPSCGIDMRCHGLLPRFVGARVVASVPTCSTYSLVVAVMRIDARDCYKRLEQGDAIYAVLTQTRQTISPCRSACESACFRLACFSPALSVDLLFPKHVSGPPALPAHAQTTTLYPNLHDWFVVC